MLEEYIQYLSAIWFLLVGIAGCIYGLDFDNKYSMYRKSDTHYQDGDNT